MGWPRLLSRKAIKSLDPAPASAEWNPANPENKQRTRALQRESREHLLRWDPIGVAATPEAEDEYDCLISPLMRQLYDGVSERAIGEWLIAELKGHFGMAANRKREMKLAHDLVAWWQAATSA